jgi:hypothetical protein
MSRKRTPKRRRIAPGHLPRGWTAKKVREIAAYYDNQSDEEAIAEAEAAYGDAAVTVMAIPIDLVPAVTQLLKRRRAG